METDNTSTIYRKRRFFITRPITGHPKIFLGLFSVIAIAALLTYSYYRNRPDLSALSIELRTEKTTYVQGEPIRITVILTNKGDKDITLVYPNRINPLRVHQRFLTSGDKPQNPDSFDFLWPRKLGKYVTRKPPSFMFWASPRSERLVTFKAHSTKAVSTWKIGVATSKSLFFSPGTMKMKTSLLIPAIRPGGRHIYSNEVTLQITPAEGIDGEALEYILNRISSTGKLPYCRLVNYGRVRTHTAKGFVFTRLWPTPLLDQTRDNRVDRTPLRTVLHG